MATSEPTSLGELPLRQPTPLWRDERFLRAAAQVLSAVLILGSLLWVGSNILTAAEQRGLGLGFRFLDETAGFPISESIIPYDPSRTFAYALWVGILNTLRISLVGVVLATLLGFLVGVALLSTNWLVSRLALLFVELHRNIPLLVLLFLWYRGVFTKLPPVRTSLSLPGPVYLNQRGLYLVWPQATATGWIFLAALGLGIAGAVLAGWALRRVQAETGRATYPAWVSLAILVLVPAVGWLLSGGAPFWVDIPVLQGFNFRGGLHLSPEFTALLIGLFTYTAAFIAEIVRAGIQAVHRGQHEAARALGLRELEILNLIVIPQALRVIIPPLISQYLNLMKNSSLAVFLGYPELFSIGKTVINQAGRAVPVFAFVMAAYLILSLATSLLLNVYNRRVQFVER